MVLILIINAWRAKQIEEEYGLMIYFSVKTHRKLDWFKIMNIAGEELTPQELKFSLYGGLAGGMRSDILLSSLSTHKMVIIFLNKVIFTSEVLKLFWSSSGRKYRELYGILSTMRAEERYLKVLWNGLEVFLNIAKEMKTCGANY